MANVGFIGLGIMGEAMATRILADGHQLCVYDIDSRRCEALSARGAAVAADVAEITAHAEFIFIMVPGSKDVAHVIAQLLTTLKSGTVIIDMSTISPLVSRQLAQDVRAHGGYMLDAPVVKSKAAAEKGELGILVGGDPAIFTRALPLLKCLGKEIIHHGENGRGLIMKLCHNMLVAQIQNGVNEMLILAQKSGLDHDAVVRSIRAGGGQNFYLDTKGDTIRSQDFSPKFPFEHMHKDLTLTKELCESLAIDLKGVDLVCDVYTQGMSAGLNRLDFSASYTTVANSL